MSALMDFLLRNAGNRGVMATLRGALVETTEIRAWPLLAHVGGLGDSRQARAVRTVAGLFALHPRNCDAGNMGTVCRQLCGADERPWEEDGAPGPMGRRLLYLLSADRDEIDERVCRLVRLAASRDIPVNYAALERDLAQWPRPREAWATAFWTPAVKAAEEEGEHA